MNNMQLPAAIRITAAAFAVFMSIATLNCLIGVAEPQQSALIAQTAARNAARLASAPRHVDLLAQAPADHIEH